ncbi:hypothetical protein MTO96_002901 [Rhipicephalus appendiculatus]
MPVSSRRCGMITKREAERLCKSFLTDTPPPEAARKLRLRRDAPVRLGLPGQLRAGALQLVAREVHQVRLLLALLQPQQVHLPLAPTAGLQVRATGRSKLQLLAEAHQAQWDSSGGRQLRLGGRQGHVQRGLEATRGRLFFFVLIVLFFGLQEGALLGRRQRRSPGLGGGSTPLSYASAFRPVAGTAVGRVARSPTLRSSTPACDTTTDPSRAASGATGAAAGSEASDGARSEDEDSDSFHGEVDVTDTSSDDGRTLVATAVPAHTSSSPPPSPAASETAPESRADGGRTPVPDTSDAGIADKQDEETNKRDAEPENAVTSVVQLIKEECRKRDALEASPYSDELRDVLLREAQARKKVEREFRLMRETFEEQVQKEVAYREELTKQLQVVRDALCQELDQERKARFAVQAKLKDTHDTMQHLACKMLGARHCAECSYKAE